MKPHQVPLFNTYSSKQTDMYMHTLLNPCGMLLNVRLCEVCLLLTCCCGGLVGVHIAINTLPPAFIIPGLFRITPSVNYSRPKQQQQKRFINPKDIYFCYVGLTFT